MKIAVSGIEGSFSHEAGRLYATAHQLQDVDFVFALDTAGCFERLYSEDQSQQVEKIIVPIHNAVGGVVNMTLEAMGSYLFVIDEYFELNVVQCLMKRKDIERAQIARVVSHEQALKQCKTYLQTEWKDYTLQEYSDTAAAAKDLSSGVLDAQSAVIAPKLSAELYGLELLEESVQDQAENPTTFLVISRHANS